MMWVIWASKMGREVGVRPSGMGILSDERACEGGREREEGASEEGEVFEEEEEYSSKGRVKEERKRERGEERVSSSPVFSPPSLPRSFSFPLVQNETHLITSNPTNFAFLAYSSNGAPR